MYFSPTQEKAACALGLQILSLSFVPVAEGWPLQG
jgi:hypothetical protein